jgi:hypothetical protein
VLNRAARVMAAGHGGANLAGRFHSPTAQRRERAVPRHGSEVSMERHSTADAAHYPSRTGSNNRLGVESDWAPGSGELSRPTPERGVDTRGPRGLAGR